MDFLSFDEGEDYVLNNGLVGATVYFLISSKALPANVNSPASGELGGGDTLVGGVGEVAYWTGGGRQTQVLGAASAGILPLATETWNTGANTDGPSAARSVIMVSTPNNSGVAIAAWPITDDVGAHVVADLSNENAQLVLAGVNYFYLNVGEV